MAKRILNSVKGRLDQLAAALLPRPPLTAAIFQPFEQSDGMLRFTLPGIVHFGNGRLAWHTPGLELPRCLKRYGFYGWAGAELEAVLAKLPEVETPDGQSWKDLVRGASHHHVGL